MATAQHTETASTIGNLARSPNLPVMLTIAAMVIGLAALLPLVQNSGATTTAGKITQLEQQKTAEQAKLRELELNVATLGSLDRIEHEAKNNQRSLNGEIVYRLGQSFGAEGVELARQYEERERELKAKLREIFDQLLADLRAKRRTTDEE